MAKKEDFKKEDQNLEEVNESLSAAGLWIEKNANLLSWIVLAVVVVVMGIIALNQYVLKPKAVEASNENAKAVVYFMAGEYEDAAKYLKKFSAKDLTIDPAASQLLGDAYVELGEYGKATAAFEAAAKSGNELIAPMSLKKAGIVYLEQGDKRAAKKAFEQVKAD